MTGRKIGDEAAALWREVFGDAPAPPGDASEVLARLLENLPEIGYRRFTKAALVDSNIVWPAAPKPPGP